MSTDYDTLATRAGVSWFDHQLETFEGWQNQQTKRALLFYKTGAGKSVTSLAMVKLAGHEQVVVIAPPSTHPAWEAQARNLRLAITCISHAKFRMKDFRLSRNVAVIADEFHLFGGHGGAGWKKLDGLARGIKAPLILCSATPNYNDAERVYCVQHILDPHSVKGGYLEFLYRHCVTQQNPHSREPDVLGFHHYADAADYLSHLPGVYYLPDDVVWSIDEHTVHIPVPDELSRYGYVERKHRVLASQMEERHTLVQQRLIDETGLLSWPAQDALVDLLQQEQGPVLVFANHATVAEAAMRSLAELRVPAEVVTGDTTKKEKHRLVQSFIDREYDVLIGTASLATGTDGLDKVCDTLIILDDTDDDALRRQLAGRILPRGLDTDASGKKVHRINLSP